jgi:hypothetical protein
MAFRSKRRADPVDRAIHDLDHQIANLQREMRELDHHASPPSRAGTFTQLIKDVLAPPPRPANSPNRSRQDLFDVGAEPLKDLEAEPIAFAQKTEPDLFAPASAAGTGVIVGHAALETAEVVPAHQKLAHYLGAGSIKSYKPLKRAQRQTRNRFFMWLGLSFVALWIIWFVIR